MQNSSSEWVMRCTTSKIWKVKRKVYARHHEQQQERHRQNLHHRCIELCGLLMSPPWSPQVQDLPLTHRWASCHQTPWVEWWHIWVDEQKDFKERWVVNSSKRLASEVVDRLLDFGHAIAPQPTWWSRSARTWWACCSSWHLCGYPACQTLHRTWRSCLCPQWSQWRSPCTFWQITLRILFCWSVSQKMLRGRSPVNNTLEEVEVFEESFIMMTWQM